MGSAPVTRHLLLDRCVALEDEIVALMSAVDDIPASPPRVSQLRKQIQDCADAAASAVEIARLSVKTPSTYERHISEAAEHLRRGEDHQRYALMLYASANKTNSKEAAKAPRRKNEVRERVIAFMRRARRLHGTSYKAFRNDWLGGLECDFAIMESKLEPGVYLIRDDTSPDLVRCVPGEPDHHLRWSDKTMEAIYSRSRGKRSLP